MKPNNGQRITTLIELYGAETVVAAIFMGISMILIKSGASANEILGFSDATLDEAELALDTEGAKIKAMVESFNVR